MKYYRAFEPIAHSPARKIDCTRLTIRLSLPARIAYAVLIVLLCCPGRPPDWVILRHSVTPSLTALRPVK